MNTSKKSGKSSAKGKRPDRPFDRAMMERAEKIVDDYRIILEHSDELGFVGSSIEIPTVFADGQSPDECVAATREALTVAVATMIEMGRRPPMGRGQRNIQINVRLTPDEKLALEEAAARLGFKGISDYVRAAALRQSNSAA